MEEARPEAGTLIRNVGVPSGALTFMPKAHPQSPHCFLYPCSPACCEPGLTSGLSVVSMLSLLMGLQPPAPSQSKSSRPLPVPVSPFPSQSPLGCVSAPCHLPGEVFLTTLLNKALSLPFTHCPSNSAIASSYLSVSVYYSHCGLTGVSVSPPRLRYLRLGITCFICFCSQHLRVPGTSPVPS